MKVKDCMCKDVCSVKPEETINNVAKLMNEYHIGCVPVCDSNGCVCGLVTDRDILLRSVACNKDTNTTPISDIMTCNVCTCKEDDEVSNAETKMGEYQIRRIPVCDKNDKIVGILTLGNLAENDKTIGTQEVCTTLENICNCHTSKNAE